MVLHLFCPERRVYFDSGIAVTREALKGIEQIAVRIRCPVCNNMHLLFETGELDEEATS
jgi:hypothetical protein